MTEEIIRAITEAEEKAAEEKQAASLAAANILEAAQKECAQSEKATAEACRAYKENEKKTAEASAQKAYLETLERQQKSAEKYCVEILSNVDTAVSKIVGRITRGDC